MLLSMWLSFSVFDTLSKLQCSTERPNPFPGASFPYETANICTCISMPHMRPTHGEHPSLHHTEAKWCRCEEGR